MVRTSATKHPSYSKNDSPQGHVHHVLDWDIPTLFPYPNNMVSGYVVNNSLLHIFVATHVHYGSHLGEISDEVYILKLYLEGV